MKIRYLVLEILIVMLSMSSKLVFSQSSLDMSNYVAVKGGTFTMGSNKANYTAASHAHKVTVSDYMLGKFEVTVGDFKAFVDDTGYVTDAEKEEFAWAYSISKGKWERKNTLNWRMGPTGTTVPPENYNHPVVYVSYNDAVAFCKWISKKLKKSIKLPTEAEWEFAASNRGSLGDFCWGDFYPPKEPVANIADMSTKYRYGNDYWFYLQDYNDGYDFLAPVGSYPPNELGIYDLCGNVYELCSDYYCTEYYSLGEKHNPQGPENGKPHPPKNVIGKVVRGGSYYVTPKSNNIKSRMYYGLSEPCHNLGFRVAISLNNK